MLDNLKLILESCRVPDAICQEAYDQTPASCLAAIKTALALAAFHFQVRPPREDILRSSPSLGFYGRIVKTPAEAALLVFPADYPAMARVCACACLPLLAGVEEILAICIGDKPSPHLLATLELCGVENIYAFADNSSATAVAVELAANKDLPVAALGMRPFQAKVPDWLWDRPCFFEKTDPKIAVPDPAIFNRESFNFALGMYPEQAVYLPGQTYDAVYASHDLMQRFETGAARLYLEPGCEGFWVFPQLDPGFFQKKLGFFGFENGVMNGMH